MNGRNNDERKIPGGGSFHLVTKLAPAIVIAIVIILFFNKLIFSKLVIARGDIFLYFFPYWRAASQALRMGSLPLWNPNLFMGVPFIANSQIGFFYPLNWPLWLLLPAHYAISATIILHVFIGAFGTYLAGRSCLSLGRGAAILSGLMFGLGGYLVAQVEHVNQLQGSVWLPWFFYVICRWQPKSTHWKAFAKLTLALALLFSLQLLSGHTQTFFITVVGMLIWVGVRSFLDWSNETSDIRPINTRITLGVKRLIFAAIPIILGGLLAILIAGIQLVPTLELAGQSSRQQGLPLNEVLSFSLNPLVLTKALFPLHGQSLFSEYVAMLPLTALFLAVIGILVKRSETNVKVLVILLIVSFFLAFGLFNPVNHLLARIPGFNLFRAPARWLILYALAMAMLMGLGLQVLKDKFHDDNFPRSLGQALLVSLILFSLLAVWGLLARFLAPYVPVGAEVVVESPNLKSFTFWLLELAIIAILLFSIRFVRNRKNIIIIGFAILSLITLYIATRSLPYANPTTPEAYEDLRPPTTRLWASARCSSEQPGCQQPPARFLSLSDIFFDIGDQPEIDTIYAEQLSEDARYDYTIAAKQKEIIGPNLAMAYDLPSVDGFDGGVLPLHSFTQLTSLMLDQDQQSTDGRLREYLTTIPDDHLLDLFNARYLITDKVGDAWRDDLFFDLQHNQVLTNGGQTTSIGYLPPYEATEISILTDGVPGLAEVKTIDNFEWILRPEEIESDLFRYEFPNPAELTSIRFLPCNSNINETCQKSYLLKGAVLVDRRDESFNPLVIGNYRLIHSGDVKIYENLDAQPRAFIVHDWQSVNTLDKATELMRSASFEPTSSAVVVADNTFSHDGSGESSARIVEYQPERISLQVESDNPGLLVLTDAFYPGWKATIDGEMTEILQTDVLFRGIMVPAGEYEVEFSYEPDSLTVGRVLSAAGVVIWLFLAGLLLYLDDRLRRFVPI